MSPHPIRLNQTQADGTRNRQVNASPKHSSKAVFRIKGVRLQTIPAEQSVGEHIHSFCTPDETRTHREGLFTADIVKVAAEVDREPPMFTKIVSAAHPKALRHTRQPSHRWRNAAAWIQPLIAAENFGLRRVLLLRQKAI